MGAPNTDQHPHLRLQPQRGCRQARTTCARMGRQVPPARCSQCVTASHFLGTTRLAVRDRPHHKHTPTGRGKPDLQPSNSLSALLFKKWQFKKYSLSKYHDVKSDVTRRHLSRIAHPSFQNLLSRHEEHIALWQGRQWKDELTSERRQDSRSPELLHLPCPE